MKDSDKYKLNSSINTECFNKLGNALHYFNLEIKNEIKYWLQDGDSEYIVITDCAIYRICFFKEKSKFNGYIYIPFSRILKAFTVSTMSFGDFIILDCSNEENEMIVTWHMFLYLGKSLINTIEIINDISSKAVHVSDDEIIFHYNNKDTSLNAESNCVINETGRKGALKQLNKQQCEWMKLNYEKKIDFISCANNKHETSEEKHNFCTECGFELNGKYKFCPNCGNKIKSGNSNQHEYVEQKVYNPYKDKGCKQSDKEYKYSHGSLSVSPKKQYKANKKVGIVSCPKCGSTSITMTNKKISVGKGAVGAAVGSIVNPVGTIVGAAVGATHSKKIYNVCMNCGHRWKP